MAPSQKHCRLSVVIDIERSRVAGVVTVPAGAHEEVRFETGPLAVTGVEVNGRAVSAAVRDGELVIVPDGSGEIAVRYEGTFRGGEGIGDRNYGVVSSAIDRRGVSLTGLWYPRPALLASWTLTATLPHG